MYVPYNKSSGAHEGAMATKKGLERDGNVWRGGMEDAKKKEREGWRV